MRASDPELCLEPETAVSPPQPGVCTAPEKHRIFTFLFVCRQRPVTACADFTWRKWPGGPGGCPEGRQQGAEAGAAEPDTPSPGLSCCADAVVLGQFRSFMKNPSLLLY